MITPARRYILDFYVYNVLARRQIHLFLMSQLHQFDDAILMKLAARRSDIDMLPAAAGARAFWRRRDAFDADFHVPIFSSRFLVSLTMLQCLPGRRTWAANATGRARERCARHFRARALLL